MTTCFKQSSTNGTGKRKRFLILKWRFRLDATVLLQERFRSDSGADCTAPVCAANVRTRWKLVDCL